MRILELVQDSKDGGLSISKVWTHIGYAAGTFAFIKMAILGTASADIWFVYLGIIGGSDVAKKLIAARKDVLMKKDAP